MAAEAVFLVVRCDLLVGRIGFEEGPSPAITPKRIAAVAAFFILDHHEPDLRSRSPMLISVRHSSVIGPEDLFHQYGCIGVLSRLAVILCGPGGSVRVVHQDSRRCIEYNK